MSLPVAAIAVRVTLIAVRMTRTLEYYRKCGPEPEAKAVARTGWAFAIGSGP